MCQDVCYYFGALPNASAQLRSEILSSEQRHYSRDRLFRCPRMRGTRSSPYVCSTRSSSFDVQLRGMRVHGIGCRVLPFVHHTRRTLASQSPLLPSRNVKQGRHKNYTLHPSGSGSEGVAIGFPPCAGIPSWRPRRRARGSAATSLLRAHRHHLGSNLGSATEPARQPTSLPTIPEA